MPHRVVAEGSPLLPERPLIAVVDDEASIRLAIRSLIKSAGYRVEVFASAGEFLESEARDNTHCLVTDVRMPEIDGWNWSDDFGLGIFGYQLSS